MLDINMHNALVTHFMVGWQAIWWYTVLNLFSDYVINIFITFIVIINLSTINCKMCFGNALYILLATIKSHAYLHMYSTA